MIIRSSFSVQAITRSTSSYSISDAKRLLHAVPVFLGPATHVSLYCPPHVNRSLLVHVRAFIIQFKLTLFASVTRAKTTAASQLPSDPFRNMLLASANYLNPSTTPLQIGFQDPCLLLLTRYSWSNAAGYCFPAF